METTVKKQSRKFSMTTKAKQRRERVIKRLETQLKGKFKIVIKETLENGVIKKWAAKEELTEKDVARINKELTILKSRI